jgi:predicted amidohydrolase YtcJ
MTGLPVDLLIRAPRAVTGDPDKPERPLAVGVTDGQITAVEPLDATTLVGRDTLDLNAGEVLMPGLVDSHVHVCEPGHTDWEVFRLAFPGVIRRIVIDTAHFKYNASAEVVLHASAQDPHPPADPPSEPLADRAAWRPLLARTACSPTPATSSPASTTTRPPPSASTSSPTAACPGSA